MADPEYKERLRREFPQMTKIADEFRAVFGAGVKLYYMKEGGREIGCASTDVGVTPRIRPHEPEAQPPPPRGRARMRDKWDGGKS